MNRTAQKNREMDEALHRAVYNGKAEEVRDLIQSGADVRQRDPDMRMTLLHLAVMNTESESQGKTVRLLLDEGLSVDAVDFIGRTPLHIVCDNEGCDPAAIAMLIEHGSDCGKRHKFGQTPLDDATGKPAEGPLREAIANRERKVLAASLEEVTGIPSVQRSASVGRRL